MVLLEINKKISHFNNVLVSLDIFMEHIQLVQESYAKNHKNPEKITNQLKIGILAQNLMLNNILKVPWNPRLGIFFTGVFPLKRGVKPYKTYFGLNCARKTVVGSFYGLLRSRNTMTQESYLHDGPL